MDTQDSDQLQQLAPADPKGEALKLEQYRRSLDKVMVYNPTDEDFDLIYTEAGQPEGTGYHYIIPARNKNLGYGPGRRILERYLADRYFTRMKVLLINKMADDELRKIKERMESRGMSDITYNANAELERTGKYRTDNRELNLQIKKQIILGLVERFGLDQPAAPKGPAAVRADIMNDDAILMQDIPMFVDDTPTAATVAPAAPAERVRDAKGHYVKQKQAAVEEVSA